ncbi:DNA mismatch repair protein pms1 [Histoplasma capsulatum G186AR]|uniref:DNA mismatch repair protein PMS1 n=1 Tax=Ajellomyces capsulatus (strain G186AR / H82 / ATCC MYA-2454 / RMSCC 2432) TaxID=447093 RepID=C0NSM0_AJECG|nr:DNA mismatch repair protein pms1 [Histoplasma capsulatum G186AR]EEH05886.1 DNA mismatch repair protein pms1 [Histoplasma capsulatum G186AR]
MGALLSLPLMAVPSVGTLITFCASCCGAATCSAICSACGKFQSSMATRIAYAVILLFNSILSWIMLTRWALSKLEHLTFDFLPISCEGEKCYGWVAVHRINFALGLFHVILALLLLGVRSSKDGRAGLQNGFWGPKIIAWLLLVVMSFFIPEGFFFVWGSYISFIGAILFLLLGLILLVDLAHTWAEICLQKIEELDSQMWRVLLIGSTLGMYLASIAMTVIMYIFFANSGCTMNQAAITTNLIIFLIISVVSVQPAVQASNPRAGLAQAAMVTVYCTYLMLSAVSMEPDDRQCNPLVRARGTRTASIVIGAIVTMLTIAYTTTRAATQGIALGSNGARNNYSRLGQDEMEHGLVTQQPGLSRREMRAEALRAAVESGSLPASALDESDDESDDERSYRDDERHSTQYNYSLFHVIFFLATTWVATLLTQNLDPEAKDNLAPVGRTYWASWVKIISALVHQIQSGQVIVDLCSVVKELVENSLDAGATSLDIRFKNNGLDLIEVQDNGKGISPDDYETVALKHYTSKLSKFDDLSSLQTFGFRGEALSSLCALSNFHIITAQAHEVPKASRLEFEISGKLKSTHTVAGQKGTTASVENLFNRLPVRRRELEKNIKREYGKVLGLLHAYACISTGVRFNVKNQMPKGKSVVVFATKSNTSTNENISNIYGAKTLLALTPLDLELEFKPSGMGKRLIGAGTNDPNKIFVQGHISRPIFGEGRQTPDRQMFFVNSRPCGLPQIAKAFNEVYKSFNISQSPFIFADFKMDTNSYDVNVSPDKRTILLHDAGALIESLKVSLTELFERQDQTVPQSQISGKQSMLQHSSGTNIPKFISKKSVESSAPQRSEEIVEADGNNEEDEQRAMRAFVQRFTGRSTTAYDIPEIPETQENAAVADSPQSAEECSVANEGVPQPVTTSQGVEENISPEYQSCENEKNSLASTSAQLLDEQSDNRANSAFTLASSLLRQQPLQSVRSSPAQHTPNVIQNAFDRMRPSRPPPELATITVGNRTVTSTIGREQTKRKFGATSLGGSSSRPKRRIHVSTSGSKLGQGLRSYAAPGTQMDDGLERISSSGEQGHLDAESESESDDHDEELDEIHSGQENEHECDNSGKQIRRDDMEVGKTTELHDEPEVSDSDASYVDEQEKRVREEARVTELIQAAEEKASIPSEDTIRRVNKISKRSVGGVSTVDLVGSINGSLARIKAHVRLLQEELQNIKNTSSTISEGEITQEPGEPGSAETRLSLSVSKEDFARMRIIGQFNLGFIIVTRPRGNPNDPRAFPSHKNDEVFIIDQHASDEKYNFERLQAETVVQNQRLVKPKILTLTAVEEEIIIDNLPTLEKNGFVVEVDRSGDEPIGRRCKLTSLPLSKEMVFDTQDLEELIVLLGESPQTQSASSPSSSDSVLTPTTFGSKYIPRPSKVRKMFAMRACRSSIMIGKTLTNKQMDCVVRHMGMIDKPWNCPHGRPTMRHLMSLGEWSAWDEWEAATQLASEDGGDVRPSTGIAVWKRFLSDLDED